MRQEEDDGNIGVGAFCDKRDRAMRCVLCRDLLLKLVFSGHLLWLIINHKKTCLKEGKVRRKILCKQYCCHACHTRFTVIFPLLLCWVSSLILGLSGDLLIGVYTFKNAVLKVRHFFVCRWNMWLKQRGHVWRHVSLVTTTGTATRTGKSNNFARASRFFVHF